MTWWRGRRQWPRRCCPPCRSDRRVHRSHCSPNTDLPDADRPGSRHRAARAGRCSAPHPARHEVGPLRRSPDPSEPGHTHGLTRRHFFVTLVPYAHWPHSEDWRGRAGGCYGRGNLPARGRLVRGRSHSEPYRERSTTAGLQALIDARGARVHGDRAHGQRRGNRQRPDPSVDDLPRGWGDEQDTAHYRLRRRDETPTSASPPAHSRPSRSSSRPTSCCGGVGARDGGIQASAEGRRRRRAARRPALRTARRAVLRPAAPSPSTTGC